MKPIRMNYNGYVAVLSQNGRTLPYLDVKDEVGEFIAHVGFRDKEGVEELIRQLREAAAI